MENSSESANQTRLEDTLEKLSEVSDSFCMAKWYQATLHLHNGNTHSCHHVMPHKVKERELLENGAQALHNTPKKKKARQQMLRGERPKECDYCWRIEDRGEISDRAYKSSEDWSRPFIDKLPKDTSAGVFPRYLELAFDNTCNFKCMYCSPVYSSSWEAEVKKYGPYPTSRFYNNLSVFKLTGQASLNDEQKSKYVDAFWQWWPKLKSHLHHLRVTGGEPLLTEQTWHLLRELENQTLENLNFAVNSNLGLSPKVTTKFIQSLNRVKLNLKTVTLYASIDSTGRQAEYIRFGLSEGQFFENLERLIVETDQDIRVSLMITVNALSIFGIKSLMSKISDLKSRYPRCHIGFDTPYLKNPQHLSLHILPNEMSEYIEEAVNFMREDPQFNEPEVHRLVRLVALMKNSPWGKSKTWLMRRDFYKMMKEHDKRRKTHFLETFPELGSFWKQIEKTQPWI